jgi:hypothetical protein
MPNSKVRQWWSSVQILLLVYTAFVTPVRITFLDQTTATEWVAIDAIIDCLFLIDIAITLNSTIYSIDGDLICDRK